LIDDADRVLTEGQSQLEALMLERDRLVAALGHAACGRPGISAEFDELRKERDQLKEALSRGDSQLHDRDQVIQDLESERDQLRVELEQAKATLENVKSGTDRLAPWQR
jgi:chromosome segregation ATPase